MSPTQHTITPVRGLEQASVDSQTTRQTEDRLGEVLEVPDAKHDINRPASYDLWRLGNVLLEGVLSSVGLPQLVEGLGEVPNRELCGDGWHLQAGEGSPLSLGRQVQPETLFSAGDGDNSTPCDTHPGGSGVYFLGVKAGMRIVRQTSPRTT